jgi:putative addiction module component (TIGR02574 family)
VARSTEKILKDAMQLPDEDRLELATELLGSVTPEVPGVDRSDEEWIAEIDRRAAASTQTSGRPWREVKAEIEAKLARK